MPVDLIINLSELQNGVKLTFSYGSQKLEALCLEETLGSIIAQVNKGYMELAFPHAIVGRISQDSNADGSSLL